MEIRQNEEQLRVALKNVLNDDNFKKSARSVHLLGFLFEKAIEHIEVNEVIIGEELFKNNYSYENSDSKVRVYMHYLRKKLEEYYLNNKTAVSIQFELKKGQYNLSYSAFDLKKRSAPTHSSVMLKPNYIFIALGLAVGLFLGFLFSKQSISFGNKYCWDVFFNTNAENLCVIADHTVISHQHSSGLLASIHPLINTKKDYIDYIQKHPETHFELANYTVMTKMAPIATKTLNTWFIKHNSDFSVRLEKVIEMDEIHDKNFIFIGSFRIMGNFSSIFLSNSKKFSLNEDRSEIISTENGIKKIHHTQYPNWHRDKSPNKELFIEYAMVSFMSMENGNKGLFFSSNHDIGVLATTNRFTDEDWLKDFYKSNGIDSDAQFNALFEVSGLDRSELGCKLLELEVLKDD